MSAATLSKPTTSLGRVLIAGLTGGVIAAVINALIYFAAQGINGGPLVVQTPQALIPQPLPLPAVLLFRVAPGLAAGVVYWALTRFTHNPARWFLLVAGLVFVLFFFGPIGAASGKVAVWALEFMHLELPSRLSGQFLSGRGVRSLWTPGATFYSCRNLKLAAR